MHRFAHRHSRFLTWSPRRACRPKACALLVGLAAFPLMALSGCGDGEEVVEITERREITQPVAPPAEMSETQRFGFDVAGAPTPTEAMGEAAQGDAAPHYHWTTPTGWTEAAPTSLRLANLRVAGQDNAECYFTVLPGGGGGVAANVNRWRAQMGLDPMDSDAIAALPKASLLDLEAVYVELDGVYSGMRGEVNEPGFRMVGLIAEDAENAYFVKMTGPQALLAAEMEGFQLFVDTLHVHHGSHDQGHAHDVAGGAEGGMMGGGMELPAGHPPIDNAAEATAGAESGLTAPHAGLDGAATAADPSQVKWAAPEHWTRGADRAMRLVTYTMGESQCYVTVLGGDGGGVAANINRWRGQMEQPELSPAEIADLPSIPMLDGQAIYVEITGDYTGMTGPTQPEAMLLGAILLLEESSLFVLMTGPESEVREEIEHFKDFCASFHW